MSNPITLPELQEFIAGFWFHYDEADYEELTVRYAEDVHYVTRSDSGSSPFEELMSPELHGRDAVMAWLSEHRKQSPYPLRHHATNVHRTGTHGDTTRARFYIFVNQVANFVPFAVSSGVANVGVRRVARGLEFTEMDIILDTTNSVLLSELHSDSSSA
ncbi:MAG TPA: nuclear transport factor 2 family protein [Mycobacterium sp.]|nr:nuclear transport factor 2 family protein [Mycobacterium sp.]